MGGLWVDFEQQTNIPGVYAAGEADYSIHGANRLGANSLLSCIYGGMVTGPAMATYVDNLDRSAHDLSESVFAKAQAAEEKSYEEMGNRDGDENPYQLHKEIGELMLRDCTIERHNSVLDKVIEKIG